MRRNLNMLLWKTRSAFCPDWGLKLQDSMDPSAVRNILSVAVSGPVLGHRMWVIADTPTGNFRETLALLCSFLWTACEDRNWLAQHVIYSPHTVKTLYTVLCLRAASLLCLCFWLCLSGSVTVNVHTCIHLCLHCSLNNIQIVGKSKEGCICVGGEQADLPSKIWVMISGPLVIVGYKITFFNNDNSLVSFPLGHIIKLHSLPKGHST